MSTQEIIQSWENGKEPYRDDETELPPLCEYQELPPDYLFYLPNAPANTWTLFRKSRSGMNLESQPGLYPVPWCICAQDAIIQPWTWNKDAQ